MLLPTRCPGCGRAGPVPCHRCRVHLRRPEPAAAPPGLTAVVALLAYEDPARQLVARLKYRNHRDALAWLAAGLAGEVARLPGRPGLVTWVPTTPSRARRRGFDHAELLARAVARRLGLPVRPLLARAEQVPQTGRPRRDRLHGPQFSLLPTAVRRPPTGPVLAVDDVCTTGATLAAAARCLAPLGVPVAGAVAARTPARA